MIKPWTKVHSITYLTYGEGWVKPVTPRDDFFDYVAEVILLDGFHCKVEVCFGRRYYQAIWRDYVPFCQKPPVHFMSIRLDKLSRVIDTDGIVLLTKKFEMDMTDIEVSTLESSKVGLADLIKHRIAHKLVYEASPYNGRQVQQSHDPRKR